MNTSRKNPAPRIDDDDEFEQTQISQLTGQEQVRKATVPTIKEILEEQTEIRPPTPAVPKPEVKPALKMPQNPDPIPQLPIETSTSHTSTDKLSSVTSNASITSNTKKRPAVPETTDATIQVTALRLTPRVSAPKPIEVRRPKIDLGLDAPTTQMSVEQIREAREARSAPSPLETPRVYLPPQAPRQKEHEETTEFPPETDEPSQVRPRHKSRRSRRRSDELDLKPYIKGGIWVLVLGLIAVVLFKPNKSSKLDVKASPPVQQVAAAPVPPSNSTNNPFHTPSSAEQLLNDLDQAMRKAQDQIR